MNTLLSVPPTWLLHRPCLLYYIFIPKPFTSPPTPPHLHLTTHTLSNPTNTKARQTRFIVSYQCPLPLRPAASTFIIAFQAMTRTCRLVTSNSLPIGNELEVTSLQVRVIAWKAIMKVEAAGLRGSGHWYETINLVCLALVLVGLDRVWVVRWRWGGVGGEVKGLGMKM